MNRESFTHDMTMMFAIHDALRRELRHIARVNAAGDPHPVLRTTEGWGTFKTFLHIHHEAEDEVLWPAVRAALADRPGDLAVVEAMEAEHATVDPGIAAVDAALADHASGPARLGVILDRLGSGLGLHLRHEEDEALALIDAVATPELLERLSTAHITRLGPDGIPRFVPWLLDGADEPTTDAVLGRLPAPVRQAYRDVWLTEYARADLWATADRPATA